MSGTVVAVNTNTHQITVSVLPTYLSDVELEDLLNAKILRRELHCVFIKVVLAIKDVCHATIAVENALSKGSLVTRTLHIRCPQFGHTCVSLRDEALSAMPIVPGTRLVIYSVLLAKPVNPLILFLRLAALILSQLPGHVGTAHLSATSEASREL